MLEVERFEKIMEYLREKKTAPVNVLAKRLFVSEATMRRDLSELERKGLVKRLHGGAILFGMVPIRNCPYIYESVRIRMPKESSAKKPPTISWKARQFFSMLLRLHNI